MQCGVNRSAFPPAFFFKELSVNMHSVAVEECPSLSENTSIPFVSMAGPETEYCAQRDRL